MLRYSSLGLTHMVATAFVDPTKHFHGGAAWLT